MGEGEGVSVMWWWLYAVCLAVHVPMICAPPMIVLIRLACPGQSTKVTCILSYGVSLR